MSNILKSLLKSQTNPFNLVFFILSTEKSFEMFGRHNGVSTFPEFLSLNTIIYVPLTNN